MNQAPSGRRVPANSRCDAGFKAPARQRALNANAEGLINTAGSEAGGSRMGGHTARPWRFRAVNERRDGARQRLCDLCGGAGAGVLCRSSCRSTAGGETAFACGFGSEKARIGSGSGLFHLADAMRLPRPASVSAGDHAPWVLIRCGCPALTGQSAAHLCFFWWRETKLSMPRPVKTSARLAGSGTFCRPSVTAAICCKA